MDLLDKKIIHSAIKRYQATNFDDDEKWETVFEELQAVRIDQKGEELEVFSIINKIDKLYTECRIKRGELVRVGNMIMPSPKNLEKWKGFTKVAVMPEQ